MQDIQGVQSTLNEHGKRVASLEGLVETKVTKIKTDTARVTSQLTSLEQEQILHSLPYAEGAALDSHLSQRPSCLPNTRVGILADIDAWQQAIQGEPIFWLNGMAGTGKSTLAATVAARLRDTGCLAGSFVFSRGAGDLARATRFVTTMAVQMAEAFPATAEALCRAVEENRGIYRIGLRDQWMQLILRPLREVGARGAPQTLTFVVDALDECESESDVRLLMQLFAEVKIVESLNIKVFLTSRPDVPIRLGFKGIGKELHQDFVLHDISQEEIRHDIALYLAHEFGLIAKDHELPENWPGGGVISELTRRADKLFIYAATIFRFIRDSPWSPRVCLSKILDGDKTLSETRQLDVIYDKVISASVRGADSNESKLIERFKEIVGSIAVLFDAFSIATLSEMLNVGIEEVQATLKRLHSVLIVPDSLTERIQLLHPSFRDFLLNEKRCTSSFYVTEALTHKSMVENCVRVMSQHLKQDICNLKNSNFLTGNTDPNVIVSHIPPDVQYASVYWVSHFECSLKGGEFDQSLLQNIYTFLKEHILHLFEALSLLKKMDAAVSHCWSLRSLCKDSGHDALSELAHDAYKFSVTNRYIIEQAPLQTYSSGWILDKSSLPTNDEGLAVSRDSQVWAVTYEVADDAAAEIVETTVLQVHSGNTQPVRSVDFSPSGERIASGSADSKVRIWDTATGTLLQTCSAHTDWMRSVAFSPTGDKIASGSMDNTVRVFDTATGTLLRTCEGHTGSVWSVVFTADGESLWSSGEDGTIRQWDGYGKSVQTLKDEDT